MKTVAEVARELGVTPKTVYRWLNKVKQGVTEKINGIMYVTDEGETYLKEVCLTGYNHVKQGENADNNEILFLREQIKMLQEELYTERAHGREMAERLAQIMENQQKLIGIEKIPMITEKKRSLFGFMKKKNDV